MDTNWPWKFVSEVCQTINFRGTVLIGGSQISAEASDFSDWDCYFIALTTQELLRVIRQKTVIIRLRTEFQLPVSCILLTNYLFNHSWYYVAGQDKNGCLVENGVDKSLLANQALKASYREWLLASLTTDEKRSYHLGKAMLQGLSSLMLSLIPKEELPRPLFRVKLLSEKILSRLALSNQEIVACQRLLQYKLTPMQEISSDDEALVSQVIENAYLHFLQRSFSFRSYVLYNLWALKHNSPRYLFVNPDKMVVYNLRQLALCPPNERRKETVEYFMKQVWPVVII